MQPKYPFMEIVREKLKAMDKNINWISSKTGRSERWFFAGPEIEKIEYQILMEISKALDFDFIADHRKHMGDTEPLPEFNVAEENLNYTMEEKRITLQMQLSATVKDIQQHYGEMLQIIQAEGEKYGFEIV